MLRIATGESMAAAIEAARIILATDGKKVVTTKWQGFDAPQPFWEFMNLIVHAPMPDDRYESILQIKPNLPWADEHFYERIGGKPLNPGESYKKWPFYGRDAKVRTENEKFSHTYMERFWPKMAGKILSVDPVKEDSEAEWHPLPMRGIHYEYGDLQDVINLLAKEPSTRQAYLPIFFPEDTGSVHGGRVPCTLGYLFMIRDNKLHCTYHIRSCDFLRHFRDDIYLAVRLTNHIRELLNDYEWVPDKPEIQAGDFTMHITSLHIFEIELARINKP